MLYNFYRKYKLRNLGATLDTESAVFIGMIEDILFNLEIETLFSINFYFHKDKKCRMDYDKCNKKLFIDEKIIYTFKKYPINIILEELIFFLSEHYKIEIANITIVEGDHFIAPDILLNMEYDL